MPRRKVTTMNAHRILAAALLAGGVAVWDWVWARVRRRPDPFAGVRRSPTKSLAAHSRWRLGAWPRRPGVGYQYLPRLHHERQPGCGRNRLSVAAISVVPVPAGH